MRGPALPHGPLHPSLRDEAGFGHEIFMSSGRLRDPGPEFITGHESSVERALGHEVLPLRRLANLREKVDVVVDRILRYVRSEEHTSELQSLMRISSAVFCLNKKTQ